MDVKEYQENIDDHEPYLWSEIYCADPEALEDVWLGPSKYAPGKFDRIESKYTERWENEEFRILDKMSSSSGRGRKWERSKDELRFLELIARRVNRNVKRIEDASFVSNEIMQMTFGGAKGVA